MAAYLHDDVLDGALAVLTNATNKVLHICSSQPANYAAVAGVTIGNKTGLSIGAAADRTPSGRKVTVAAISSGGELTADATASHYAIVDGTRLLVANTLSANQVVYDVNTFTMAAFDIGIPDPS